MMKEFSVQGGLGCVPLYANFVHIIQVNKWKSSDFNREAAKKGSFLSGRTTKRGGGAKRVCH